MNVICIIWYTWPLTSECSGRVSVTGDFSLHSWCIEFIDYNQFCYINLHCDYAGEYGFITNYVDL